MIFKNCLLFNKSKIKNQKKKKTIQKFKHQKVDLPSKQAAFNCAVSEANTDVVHGHIVKVIATSTIVFLQKRSGKSLCARAFVSELGLGHLAPLQIDPHLFT